MKKKEDNSSWSEMMPMLAMKIMLDNMKFQTLIDKSLLQVRIFQQVY